MYISHFYDRHRASLHPPPGVRTMSGLSQTASCICRLDITTGCATIDAFYA